MPSAPPRPDIPERAAIDSYKDQYLAFCQKILYLLQQYLGPCGRRRRCIGCGGRRALELIDALDDDEDREGDHQKLEDGLQEGAVLEEHGLACRVGGDLEGELTEVDAPEYRRQQRHDYIADERGDDLAEGRTDHDADREVEHAALHGKFFEFRSETHGGLLPSSANRSAGCRVRRAPSSCGSASSALRPARPRPLPSSSAQPFPQSWPRLSPRPCPRLWPLRAAKLSSPPRRAARQWRPRGPRRAA